MVTTNTHYQANMDTDYDILPSISKNIITINVKPETVSRLHAGIDVVCNKLSPLLDNTINKVIVRIL